MARSEGGFGVEPALIFSVGVETSDTIVPYGAPVPDAGGLDVAPQLPINLDIHFPGLPCSDIALEITDESGGDALPYSSSVSKLRTGV